MYAESPLDLLGMVVYAPCLILVAHALLEALDWVVEDQYTIVDDKLVKPASVSHVLNF